MLPPSVFASQRLDPIPSLASQGGGAHNNTYRGFPMAISENRSGRLSGVLGRTGTLGEALKVGYEIRPAGDRTALSVVCPCESLVKCRFWV